MPTKEQESAFAAYEFDSDPAWKYYFNNLTIPPGRSDEASIIRRYKQKYYKQHVDPSFEVESLKSAQSSSNPDGNHPSDQTPQMGPSDQTRTRSQVYESGQQSIPQGSRNGSAGVAGRNPPTGLLQHFNPQTIIFFSHALVVVLSVLALFPLTPRPIMYKSYRFAFLSAIFVSALSVYRQHGLPRALTLDACKIWLQSGLSGPDFAKLFHCLVFLPTSPPVTMALVSVVCSSVLFVSRHLQQNFSEAQIYRQYLEQSCTWLIQNPQRVELFAASSDIGLGFLVIVNLLGPQRNLMQILLYWQLLKIKFHLPTTSFYHRQIWSEWGSKFEPIQRRFLPILTPVLGYAKAWFTNIR